MMELEYARNTLSEEDPMRSMSESVMDFVEFGLMISTLCLLGQDIRNKNELDVVCVGMAGQSHSKYQAKYNLAAHTHRTLQLCMVSGR